MTYALKGMDSSLGT